MEEMHSQLQQEGEEALVWDCTISVQGFLIWALTAQAAVGTLGWGAVGDEVTAWPQSNQ